MNPFDKSNRDARVVLRLESGVGVRNSGLIRVLAIDYPRGWAVFDNCVCAFGVIDDSALLKESGYWARIYAENGELLVGSKER